MLSTHFVTGAPSWLDLGSTDTAAAADFYAAVFGWRFDSAGPEAGGYGFFRKDGRTVAAVGPLTEEGASPAWTVYFQTPDADATAKAVEQGGGTVRVEPFDVMDAGRMSCLTDPGVPTSPSGSPLVSRAWRRPRSPTRCAGSSCTSVTPPPHWPSTGRCSAGGARRWKPPE